VLKKKNQGSRFRENYGFRTEGLKAKSYTEGGHERDGYLSKTAQRFQMNAVLFFCHIYLFGCFFYIMSFLHQTVCLLTPILQEHVTT